MSSLSAAARIVDLEHEQVLVVDDQPGTSIRVLSGTLWLTEEHCLQDRFAAAGQWLRLHSHGRAVAEALGHTRVQVHVPKRRSATFRSPASHARRLLREWPAMRSLAVTLALLMGIGLAELVAGGFLGHWRGAPAVAASWLGAPGSAS